MQNKSLKIHYFMSFIFPMTPHVSKMINAWSRKLIWKISFHFAQTGEQLNKEQFSFPDLTDNNGLNAAWICTNMGDKREHWGPVPLYNFCNLTRADGSPCISAAKSWRAEWLCFHGAWIRFKWSMFHTFFSWKCIVHILHMRCELKNNSGFSGCYFIFS